MSEESKEGSVQIDSDAAFKMAGMLAEVFKANGWTWGRKGNGTEHIPSKDEIATLIMESVFSFGTGETLCGIETGRLMFESTYGDPIRRNYDAGKLNVRVMLDLGHITVRGVDPSLCDNDDDSDEEDYRNLI